METIRVNMAPCEDVQTIHASQNDNEAREWGFELHNNGEKIDSSSISGQMVFKAYEGGTEEILPTNGSTPTTSPFLGDIRYPQGLLSDQEFLYRESPTEEDGLAKITDIKGNTLNWNQIYNVNSDRTTFGVNIKVVNGAVSITGTSTSTGSGPAFAWTGFKGVQGHKYIITKDFALPSGDYIFDQYNLNSSTDITTVVFTLNNSGEYMIPQLRIAQTGVTYNISGHLCVFDLTKMFGAGNEPSTVEEFTSLFSLPYYSYNQGTLLSFNGNGIKTVGKNLFDFSQFANGTITFENGILTGNGGQFYTAYSDVVNKGIELKYPKNTQITISFDARTEQNQSSSGGGLYFVASENGTAVQLATTLNSTTAIQHITVTIPSNRHIDKLGWTYGSGSNNIWHITNFQVEFGTTETSYEPYTSSIADLPISQYFPNGMDGINDVRDKISETGYVKRMKRIDLSTLSFFYNSSSGFFSVTIPDLVTGMTYATESPNVIVQNYEYKGGGVGWANMPNMSYGFNGQDIRIKNTAYTTTAEFTNAVRGTYMVYELATYEEISFTTASLVTENAEIPLSNEDGVLIGKCTEQLSAEPGFHDAKIKLADEDGECYSNKIQLHIERKPS